MLEMHFELKKKLVSIIFQTGRFITVYKPKYKTNCLPIMKVVIKTWFCSSRNFEGCDKDFFILFFTEKQITVSKWTSWKYNTTLVHLWRTPSSIHHLSCTVQLGSALVIMLLHSNSFSLCMENLIWFSGGYPSKQKEHFFLTKLSPNTLAKSEGEKAE